MKDNISEKPFNIPFVKVQNFDKRSLKKTLLQNTDNILPYTLIKYMFP